LNELAVSSIADVQDLACGQTDEQGLSIPATVSNLELGKSSVCVQEGNIIPEPKIQDGPCQDQASSMDSHRPERPLTPWEYPCSSDLQFERLYFEVHRLCELLEELRFLYPHSFGDLKFQFHWNTIVDSQCMEDLSGYREILSVCDHKTVQQLPLRDVASLVRQLDFYFSGHCSPDHKERLREWCKMMAMYRLEGFDRWVQLHNNLETESVNI